MAAKKSRGLGKGLDAVIQNKSPKKLDKPREDTYTAEGNVVSMDIRKVEPNREQPRKNFDEDALFELAESIKQFGIVQPLLVQDCKDYLEIVAGERRWRAAKIAGLKEVPIIIRNFTPQEILEISIIENIQREDLNPIEEAFAYKRLIEEFSLKQDEVAERVSKSRTTVTNTMRLLRLDERVQQMVIDRKLTTGHARALIPIKDAELQYTIAQKIFDERYNVRDTERYVKKLLKDVPVKKPSIRIDNIAEYEEMESQLTTVVGTKVSINQKNNDSGKIEIEYYSLAELERISQLLRSNKE